MTADTSAVIAALSSWHEQHEVAAAALAEIRALPAHALLEAYSVLTRLPSGLAIAPSLAADVLTRRFDGSPLTFDLEARAGVLGELACAGVFGGASYDGLIALEAAAHGRTLITLDERAVSTYRRLAVRFSLVGR